MKHPDLTAAAATAHSTSPVGARHWIVPAALAATALACMPALAQSAIGSAGKAAAKHRAVATELNPQPLPPDAAGTAGKQAPARSRTQETGIIIVGGKPAQAESTRPAPAGKLAVKKPAAPAAPSR